MFSMTNNDVKCVMLSIAPSADKSEVFRSGTIVSRFRVIPHSGNWQDSKTYRSGWELNSPLIAYTVNDTVSDKTLSPSLSFLSSSSDHDIVTVLKKEEDGNDIVVRLFEAEGKDGKTNLTFFRPTEDAWRCNLLEERQTKVNLNNMELGKNKIITLKLNLQKE